VRATLAVITAIIYIVLIAQVVAARGPTFIPHDGRTVPTFLVEVDQGSDVGSLQLSSG
jgi:hypothetical protein